MKNFESDKLFMVSECSEKDKISMTHNCTIIYLPYSDKNKTVNNSQRWPAANVYTGELKSCKARF